MKIVVVGAGKLGKKIAQAKLTKDTRITIIDVNGDVLRNINEHMDVLTIEAHGARVDILKDLKIETYDAIIAVTGSDESNILICNIAKKLGCPKAIARIRNPEYFDQMKFIKKEMQIDYVINPERVLAHEIARYIVADQPLYTGEYAQGKVSVVDIKAKEVPAWLNKPLAEVPFSKELVIIAITRDGKTIIPDGSTTIYEDDVVSVIGNREHIEKVVFEKNQKTIRNYTKRAMIMGGGRIGYYLSLELKKKNFSVKLIENNRTKCIQLSESLNDVLVIHGNGTDSNLLEEEELAKMDAFIGVTGSDEENLFMSLLAKQNNVEKVIAKVTRQNHQHIVESLGIGVVLNPVEIAASDIVRYLRGRNIISVSMLFGGEAEITEVSIGENNKSVGKTLAQLGLPKGVVIGTVLRSGDTIIPNGDTKILPGDQLVIFSIESKTIFLEKFFYERNR